MAYVILYIIVAILIFVLSSIFLDDLDDRDTEYKVSVVPATLYWPVVLPIAIVFFIFVGMDKLSHKIHNAFHERCGKNAKRQ